MERISLLIPEWCGEAVEMLEELPGFVQTTWFESLGHEVCSPEQGQMREAETFSAANFSS